MCWCHDPVPRPVGPCTPRDRRGCGAASRDRPRRDLGCRAGRDRGAPAPERGGPIVDGIRCERRLRARVERLLPDRRLADRVAPAGEPDRLDHARGGFVAVRRGARDELRGLRARDRPRLRSRSIDLAAWIGVWAWAPGFLLLGILVLLFPDGELPSRRWRPVPWIAGVALLLMVLPEASVAWGAPGHVLLHGWGPAAHDVQIVFAGRVADCRRLAERIRGAGGPRVRHRPVPQIDRDRATAAQVVRVCKPVGDRHPGGGPHQRRAVPGRHDPRGTRRSPPPDRDRRRDPSLPALRDRPPRQPNRRLGDPDRSARGRVPRRRLPAPGGARAIHHDNTIAIAASTLVAFALHSRFVGASSGAVDRRFDRARYDGQQTVDAFADRVRSSVDLDTLSAMLATTAGEAVRPAGSVVWLNARPAR